MNKWKDLADGVTVRIEGEALGYKYIVEREWTFTFRDDWIHTVHLTDGSTENGYESDVRPGIGSMFACRDRLIEQVGDLPNFPFQIVVSLDPPDDGVYCHALRKNLDENLDKHIQKILSPSEYASRAYRDFYWWIYVWE